MRQAIPLLSLAAAAGTGGASLAFQAGLAGIPGAFAASNALAGFGTAGGAFGALRTASQVLSAGASVYGGIEGYQAGRAESKMLKEQAALEATRAAQEEANRQAQLTRILSEGMSMQAGRGGQVGSGSDIAISDFSTEEARRESGIASLESRFQQSRLRSQAVQARKGGTASLISGVAGAASTLASAAESRYERTRTS